MMIIFLYVAFNFMSQAKVDYSVALNQQQLIKMSEESRHIQEQKQVCQLELKYSLVPGHCYVWLKGAELSKTQSEFLYNLFESRCLQSLEAEDSKKISYAMPLMKDLGRRCQQMLLNKSQIWIYKLAAEDAQSLMTKDESLKILLDRQKSVVNIGKGIEEQGQYEDLSSTRKNPL